MDSDLDEVRQWRDPSKICFIPSCRNNNRKNPKKTFFIISKGLKERWCKRVKRSCPKRSLYCCEDHINIKEDLENYKQFIAGAKPIIKCKATLKNIPKNVTKKSKSKPVCKTSKMALPTAACRVCLAVDVRLRTIAGSLQVVYEQITGTALYTADRKPVVACYICYAQLYKCHKLMLTAARAENVLNDILSKYVKNPVQAITEIDRQSYGLCASLSISKIECDGTLPPAVEIKLERESDVVIKQEKDAGSPLQVDDGDDLLSVTEKCFLELDIKKEQDIDEDVAPAEIPFTGQPQAEGSTTSSRQRESRQAASTRTSQRPHECSYCQLRFPTANNLIKHQTIHHNKYKCQRDLIKTHKITRIITDTGKILYKCETCQRQFSNRCNIIKHIQTHNAKKICKCETCQLHYEPRGDLIKQLRIYTGENPFRCGICLRQFNQRDNLLQHIKTHANSST